MIMRCWPAEVAGFDETGLRVAGALHWVHCARTGKYTLITCHPKRGRAGIDAAGVLGPTQRWLAGVTRPSPSSSYHASTTPLRSS
jgi:hypothetical protein